jgi:hypothetical protein
MRTAYQKLQILALIFSASVLLSAVMKGGTVAKTDSMQCPVAPNGKLHYGPAC